MTKPITQEEMEEAKQELEDISQSCVSLVLFLESAFALIEEWEPLIQALGNHEGRAAWNVRKSWERFNAN